MEAQCPNVKIRLVPQVYAGFETCSDCCRHHKLWCALNHRTTQPPTSNLFTCLGAWNAGTADTTHFITVGSYEQAADCRQPRSVATRFLEALERVRRRYRWVVLAYVVMPGHVHLLVSEPAARPLSTAMQALKLGFARRVIGRASQATPA